MSSPAAIPLNANAQSVLKSRWPFSPAPIIRHANGRWPAPRAPKTPLGQGSRQVVHDLSHVLYSAGRGDGAQIGLSAAALQGSLPAMTNSAPRLGKRRLAFPSLA